MAQHVSKHEKLERNKQLQVTSSKNLETYNLGGDRAIYVHSKSIPGVSHSITTLPAADDLEREYRFVHESAPHRKLAQARRQRKKNLLQSKYEELKSIVPYPEVFEAEDATCMDPLFYNELKGSRKYVPVPGYWKSNSGRLFPQGYEKPRYRIPSSIVNTGIPELRRMLRESEREMSLRSKIKERLYPKLGKSLADQRTLHDAFFPDYRKPYMTKYGEVFHPGLEYFMRRSSPGVISSELMEALGIDEKTPPPWLFNMQKYGIPPSYPDAEIPGLNSPIPEGCSYGYQPRGWGEPLVASESQEIVTGLEVVETIYNEENQYTRAIYTEELEERIGGKLDANACHKVLEDETLEIQCKELEINKKEEKTRDEDLTFQEEALDQGSKNDISRVKTESERREKAKKERLYKNIKF